tara:strand:+ start:4244 stop:4501 length:258 start_codon:yes stop_codon:yes gene_type:complete
MDKKRGILSLSFCAHRAHAPRRSPKLASTSEMPIGRARLLRVKLLPRPMGENGVTLESLYSIGQTIAVVATLGTLVALIVQMRRT